MTESIIQAQYLGKRYRIRHQQERQRYVALRDVLTETAQRAARRLGRVASGRVSGVGEATSKERNEEDFWALKGVTFEVRPGEVLGIIGRNGAGKTTLLKILSRITEPSEGRVRLRGRVASLLEVGTGFHPELTGRENIFLNGAILGMSRAEIRAKFDEIVAFAEVDKFLDTAVKHYSSGMYVRLAFAVAAHLEPEILIVDEVLAVGDAQFQKKCLGKMSEVARGGRTVLFVSHNMSAVESLCERAVLLQDGRIAADSSDLRSVITRYLSGTPGSSETSAVWVNSSNAYDYRSLQPMFFAIVDESDLPLASPVRNDETLRVVIRVDVRQVDPAMNVGFALFNESSDLLLWSLSTDGPEALWPKLAIGMVELRCQIPRRFLNEGSYRLELIASLHCREWLLQPGHNSPAVNFEIQGGLSDSPYWLTARPGLLGPEWKWERVP